jgi:Helicase associated domain
MESKCIRVCDASVAVAQISYLTFFRCCSCQVPTHYHDNPKLGRWVHTQRHQRRLQLKGFKSCMTDERAELLDQLGFSWEVRPVAERAQFVWQERYNEVAALGGIQGNLVSQLENHPELHAWCIQQVRRLRFTRDNPQLTSHKALSPSRVQALHDIGITADTELTPSALDSFDISNDMGADDHFDMEDQGGMTL